MPRIGLDRRVAEQHQPVTPENGDRAVLGKTDRSIKMLEITQLDRRLNRAQKNPGTAFDAPRDEQRPPSRRPAFARGADDQRVRRSLLGLDKEAAIAEIDRRNRPEIRRIDLNPDCVGQEQRIQLRQGSQPIDEKVVGRLARHLPAELLGGGDARMGDALGRLAQHEIDRLERARQLLGQHDAEIRHVFARSADRVPVQVPKAQSGAKDRDRDQQGSGDDDAPRTAAPQDRCHPQHPQIRSRSTCGQDPLPQAPRLYCYF